MNLYTLTNDFIQFRNQLEEMDLDTQTLKDTLDSVIAPIEEKAENIIKLTKSLIVQFRLLFSVVGIMRSSA